MAEGRADIPCSLFKAHILRQQFLRTKTKQKSLNITDRYYLVYKPFREFHNRISLTLLIWFYLVAGAPDPGEEDM